MLLVEGDVRDADCDALKALMRFRLTAGSTAEEPGAIGEVDSGKYMFAAVMIKRVGYRCFF